MKNNVFETPESNVIQDSAPQFSPVNKPWVRWLIVFWMFFALGFLANNIGVIIAEFYDGDQLLAKRIGAGLFACVLVLMFGVASLSKRLIIVSAIVCVMFGVFQIVNLAYAARNGWEPKAFIGSIILFVAPSFLISWYLFQSKLHQVADKHKSYKQFVAMQKNVQKKCAKWLNKSFKRTR